MGVPARRNSRASVCAWTLNSAATSASEKSSGVAFGGSGDQRIGHFPGDAASGSTPPIELSDDRGPVDAVATSELTDRRPLLVEVHKFINDTRRQPPLHRV